MNRELIFKNESTIKEYTEVINEALPFIQKVVDEYEALKTSTTFPLEDLTGLILRIKQTGSKDEVLNIVDDFVRNAMAKPVSKPEIQGVPITHEAFKKMIEVPNIGEFAKAIQNVAPMMGRPIKPLWAEHYIIQKGTVLPNPKEIDNLEKINSYYAETPGQKLYANKLKKLASAMNEYYKFIGGTMRGAFEQCPKGIIAMNNEYHVDAQEVVANGYTFETIAKKELLGNKPKDSCLL